MSHSLGYWYKSDVNFQRHNQFPTLPSRIRFLNRPARCLANDRAFRTWLCPRPERMAWRGITAPYISNVGIIWNLVSILTPHPLISGKKAIVSH